MTDIVPRSQAPFAPRDSEFPSNDKLAHDEGCKFDQASYRCSCGLTQHLLDVGAFVRYEPSMCQVNCSKKTAFRPITEVLESFLEGLKERCASLEPVK